MQHEAVHCHRSLCCLHLHPRDGDLRSQGPQRCCNHLTDDLRQAGQGKAKCSGKRAFYCDHIIFQIPTWRKEQSIPVPMCIHLVPRPRRIVQLPVFKSPNVISGRTTPISADAGSIKRSDIALGGGHCLKDQTLVRRPVVLLVEHICRYFYWKFNFRGRPLVWTYPWGRVL